jgi:protein TonB
MSQAISRIGQFDDLVFEKRNKAYGAYVIRNSYVFHILMGLFVGLFILGSILAIPYISMFIKGLQGKKEVFVEKQVDVTLQEVAPEEEEKPEFKPETPIESIQFTVPIVTTEDVVETVTIEDVVESNPGTVTSQGIEGMPGLEGMGNEEMVGGTNTDEIFTVVEQMPEFPGGEAALHDFLDKNMQYPTMAKEQGIQGKVWIGFIVDKFGNVSNVELLRGIGGGCDEEAVRVVKMMPRWNPGKQSGRPVIVKFRFPVNFTLR